MGALSLLRIYFKLSTRYIRRHLWQSALMILGISLGVGVMVGVDLANQSASRAFELSTTALTGKATHYLSGGSQGLDEDVYVQLRRQGLALPAAPVISRYVSSPQLGGGTLQAVGIDPFVEAPFRDFLVGGEQDPAIPFRKLSAFLTQPNSVLISQTQAERHQLDVGSTIDLLYAGKTFSVTIVGLVNTEDDLNRRALNEMVLMDLSTAQELTGRIGLIDKVDLILPPGQSAAQKSLEDRLPEGVQLLPTIEENGVVSQMTRAFQVNLTALSLLALVVALFLIYNTMTFSVTQRRKMFGILRSLGLTRGNIFALVLGEALLIGLLGSILGVLLGTLMGRGTVALVSQTINDLFFVTTVRDVALPWNSLAKGGLLGVTATAVTAAFPAWEAVHNPPRTALSRSSLESRARKVIPWLSLGGTASALLGAALLAVPNGSLPLSFGATFLIILGLAMLTPLVTRWLMTLASGITARTGGVMGRMAPREVVSGISRTSVAVAALMIAVAVTIGVSVMITSFRGTVTTWLDQILGGDIYISVPGQTVNQPSHALDPRVIKALEGWEEVHDINLLQTGKVDSPAGPIQVSASNNPRDGVEQLYLSTRVPPAEIWGRVQDGGVLISEPLANRLDLSLPNAELGIYTRSGLVDFPVIGIYHDYSSTQGTALFALDTYRKYWDDDRVAAAALTLSPGADPEIISRQLEAELADIQTLLVRPNQELRRETLAIFDRTFAITRTLQVMTTVVAFTGVLSAMMSLQLDKKRQLGILRAVGLTGRQLWTLVFMETGLMGAVAGLFAMPTGCALSLILIYIINRRSFGWTMQMQLAPGPFLQALAIAVGASLLAGVLPAHRILNRSTADAIRFE